MPIRRGELEGIVKLISELSSNWLPYEGFKLGQLKRRNKQQSKCDECNKENCEKSCLRKHRRRKHKASEHFIKTK